MTDRGVPTAQEVAESEEYDSLFEKAIVRVAAMTAGEDLDDQGVRRLVVHLFGVDQQVFVFFWDESNDTFGLELIREEGPLVGETNYNFELHEGTVNLTGEVGQNHGPESLPDLIYQRMDLPMGELEDVRRAPLPVDLPRLRDLVQFIENPLLNRGLVDSLVKLPGEEEIIT